MSLNSSQVMKTNDLLDTEGGREENILPSLMSGTLYMAWVARPEGVGDNCCLFCL